MASFTKEPRQNGSIRLRESRDFERALRQGRKQQGGRWLSAHCYPNGQAQARLGIVVPKRWLRRAVDRNCAKRILREAFRRERARLAPVDVVMRLRANWNKEARAELAQEARTLLGKFRQP